MNLPWQLELSNPQQSMDWKALWEFGEEQQETDQEIVIELNRIKAPTQFRIERKPDS